MVKTPKVSPLSNRGVRAKRVPPERKLHKSHPGGVPEQRGMPGVGALFQSATTHRHPSGGIRFAQTTRLPSGDAFSVIKRVKFLKLPSGDASSVIERVRFLKLPSGDAFSVIERVKFLKLPSGDASSVITKIDKIDIVKH